MVGMSPIGESFTWERDEGDAGGGDGPRGPGGRRAMGACGDTPLGAPAPGAGTSLCGLPGVSRPRAKEDPRVGATGPRQEGGLPQADRAVVGPLGLARAGL